MITKAYLRILNQIEKWKKNGVYPFLREVEKYNHTISFADGKKVVAFGSCDYFGLSTNTYLKEEAKKAIDEFGTNTYGSQVICGYTGMHRKLEKKLVEFLGYSLDRREAVIFPSGFHANVGCISTLFCGQDIAFCDEYAHASIFIGLKLSGVKIITFKHNDISDLEKKIVNNNCLGIKVVVVDGLYSVDGDKAPLTEIVKLARAFGVKIYVDEAHSFGTVGKNGRGIAEECGVLEDIDYYVATMSKAVGSIGGFAVLRKEDANVIRHFATSYTSSRANPPGAIAASIAGIDYLRKNGEKLRAKLQANAKYLIEELRSYGLNIKQDSHIIPIIIGDNDKTVQIANFFLNHGFHVGVFITPTVPQNSARLRIGVSTFLTKEDCKEFIATFVEAKELYGI